jgi:hypothetical protein
VTPDQIEALQTSNPGGLAPADRQCRYTKADGLPCRSWAVRGQDYCHRHDLFLRRRVDKPIDVPLLEDEASIVLLLSETLRAMAWGTMPVSNGRMMLAGCRLAHTIHTQRIEAAKFRLKLRRLGIPEHEIFNPPAPAERPLQSAPSASAPTSASAPNSVPKDEPLTTPLEQPPNPRHHRFRDLKKNWDKELNKTEGEMLDMWSPRNNETRQELAAARATPSTTSKRRSAKSRASSPSPNHSPRPVYQLVNPRESVTKPGPRISNIPGDRSITRAVFITQQRIANASS